MLEKSAFEKKLHLHWQVIRNPQSLKLRAKVHIVVTQDCPQFLLLTQFIFMFFGVVAIYYKYLLWRYNRYPLL